MKTINVLSPGFTSPNSAAFLFPLIKFKRALKDKNLNVHIYNQINDNITDCDYLLIDSKYFKAYWSRDFDGTLEVISLLNSKTKVIWCDQSDSTGTFLGQVLPHVHRYLKAQLLKDKNQYTKTLYASRIFTDYYHKKYEITDRAPYIDQPIKNLDDLNKLRVSWNSAFMNYGIIGPYIPRIRAHLPINSILKFTERKTSAETQRSLDVTCRMGISYARETVCYQRKRIREILSSHVKTDKLSRSKYLKEIGNSKICVSPFGLGEITLKDFECFINGALLLKPDMSHMETWPNLYVDGETCISHKWDMDDLQAKIDWALSHKKERIHIAQNGQDVYAQHTTSKHAPEIFAQRFTNILLNHH